MGGLLGQLHKQFSCLEGASLFCWGHCANFQRTENRFARLVFGRRS